MAEVARGGVRIVRTPCRRAASAPETTASSGISSWSRSASAVAMRPSSPGARAVTVPFAPGMTTIALPPSSSTTMCAVPDGPSVVRRWSVSTPECSSVDRSKLPKASAPTAPINETSAPAWAAATAWLAPLPPGIVRNSRPVTVSALRGLGDVRDEVHVRAAEYGDMGHGRRVSRCVRWARVSKPMPLKSAIEVARRFFRGWSSGRGGRAGLLPADPRCFPPSRRWSRCPSRPTPHGRGSRRSRRPRG